jgi:glutamate synthase domain-containing protein 3
MEPTHLDDLVPRPWTAQRKPWHTTPELHVSPADRAIGARLAHEFALRRSAGEDTGELRVRYHGTAGQSFGAFLTDGIALELDGDANDYVGKSMEGGRIVVRGFGERQEPIAGNACFYGARGGEGYIRGSAGERYGVRNSGAELVVEGAGDHACEYMTRGTAVILGPVGVNVASGMSGGVLYLAPGGTVDAERHGIAFGPTDCRPTAVTELDADAPALRGILERHLAETGSARARSILDEWPRSLAQILRIAVPTVAIGAPAVEQPIAVGAP